MDLNHFQLDVDWIGTEGQYPDHSMFIPLPGLTIEPYPISMWKYDPILNDGYPYIELVPDLIKITVSPVKQKQYICVYDMTTDKPDFSYNGIAILHPTEATIHEVLNGEWTLSLTHPIDPDGKWQYIRESNIIKCQDQLFTIKRCEWDFQTKNTGYVRATCEHIFYQLNDLWIFQENVDVVKYWHCKAAMDAIMRQCTTTDESYMHRYAFEWDAEWDFTIDSNDGWTFVVNGDGCTPLELFLGSGGIIDSFEGELYRDNFYFSINKRMENANDSAFDIRIGCNLLGIKRIVDASELATWFRLKDEETGAWFGVWWSGRAFPSFQFPHTIVRSDTIRYSEKFYEYVKSGQMSIIPQLERDCFSRWRSYCMPVLYYEIDLLDVKNNPDYADISDHFRYKVGDQGRIVDDRIGGEVWLRISETETNGITGEVKKVVFGSKNSFTRTAGYPSVFEITPQGQSAAVQLHDKNMIRLRDKNAKKIMRMEES